jgi:hypothetical protein
MDMQDVMKMMGQMPGADKNAMNMNDSTKMKK